MKIFFAIVSILFVISCVSPVTYEEQIEQKPEITHTITYTITGTSSMFLIDYTGEGYIPSRFLSKGPWSKTIELTKRKDTNIVLSAHPLSLGTCITSISVDGIVVSTGTEKSYFRF